MNIIVHNSLERSIGFGLPQVDDVFSFQKKVTRHINAEQPIQSMNSMPCYGIVSSYTPRGKMRWIFAAVIETNLIMPSN